MRGRANSEGWRRVTYLFAGTIAALALVAGLALRADEPAAATPSDEAAFVSALNQTRAAAGLAPLTVDAQLTTLSRQWAQSMANAGQISHANPISAGVTADWLKLGENVGTGPDVGSIMDAFVASPSHYANIVDPEFTRVGVGVVWDGNRMYTTHRFMKVASSPAPEPAPIEAPPASGPPAETAPEPAPADAAPLSPPVVPPPALPPTAEPERVVAVLEALRLHPL